MTRRPLGVATAVVAALVMAAEAKPGPDQRALLLAQAQLWMPTNIPRMDFRVGPAVPGAFPFRATVECDYRSTDLSGRSPKFACAINGSDEVKVKFGGNNGEVYAEVAGTRLLWALGFGADAMYPVRVVCRGCPAEFYGMARENDDEYVFDPAAIERKTGVEISDRWSWKELDAVDDEGGAPRAHRDALKLLAVFMQHTDTKPVQQRLVCLDDDYQEGAADCRTPFLLINDLGLTFGRANMFNLNPVGAMNLAEWSSTPVWKSDAG